MAYSKSKYVEAAQKLLNQGKITQAIGEYQHILKYEPKDQVTLMTIGELYIRQGESFQAIDYFERLAQIFVADGFLTKAIAVYKRIAKLAPDEIRPLEKLADLYVQQGVMSEARPLFLQLAEIHLKSHRRSEAVGLLKKLLNAEPDNLRIQIRLADLYHAMGQSKDALETYVEAAQRFLARGDQAESLKLADKALKLDAKNAAARSIKARALGSEGNVAHAAQLLEGAHGLEKGGEQAELLLDLYIKDQKWTEATELALRVFEADEKNFGLAQKVAEALMKADQTARAEALVEQLRIPMMDAGEHEPITKLLNDLVARLPGRIGPLEWLVEAYKRISDSFRLPDALSQLGDALAKAGKLERAKETFEQLLERQSENESAQRRLNQVLRKLGVAVSEEPAPAPIEEPPETFQTGVTMPPAPKLPSAEEEPAAVPAVKAASSSADSPLDEETQKFISQSLTDVDLFASYGLSQKANSLLEAVLRRAPRHTPTIEKLLDFALGAGDDRRTAELAGQLEQLHQERGDERGAERFGELRRRFQRAAGISDAELKPPPPAAGVPTVKAQPQQAARQPEVAAAPAAPAAKEEHKAPPAPEPAEVAAAPGSAVHEVDLSEEWSSLLEEPTPSTEAAAPSEKAPPQKPAAGKPGAAPPAEAPAYTEFEVPLELAPAEEAQESVAQASDAGNPFAEISAEIPGVVEPAPPKRAGKDREAARAGNKAPAAKPEPEFELDQEYELVLDPEPTVPAHEQPGAVSAPPPPKAKQPAQPTFTADQFLAELASEIDQLGIGKFSPEFSKPEPPKQPAKAASPAAKGASPLENDPLREVFEEFRAELGEMGVEDEDPETHYNLGIAFREMGLLDEAISEFQKVAQANDKGRAFRYAMQCCTLLGLAFMEKGQPAIAALWYERALQTPGVESESVLALRYDLGVAQESAGELEAALKSFSRVYAMNIDYRDVAERIAALQKTAR